MVFTFDLVISINLIRSSSLQLNGLSNVRASKMLPAIQVFENGTTEGILFSKASLISETDFHWKDIQLLENPLIKPHQYHIKYYSSKIIITLNKLKIMFKEGNAFVFGTSTDYIAQFLDKVKSNRNTNNFNGFTYAILQEALNQTVDRLNHDFFLINERFSNLKCQRPAYNNWNKLELKLVRNILNELEEELVAFNKLLTRIIDFQSLLAESKYPKTRSDLLRKTILPISTSLKISEIRLSLIEYLDQIDVILKNIENVSKSIEFYEYAVQSQFSIIDNKMNILNMFLSISTFVISFGALITGIFGMNLKSNYEFHPLMFYFVSAGIAIYMSILFILIVGYCKLHKLF